MAISQEELGRRLREAREACGLTQEQVAEHLGVSRPTVAQMELGNRAIASLELDRLAWLYARDMREFVAEHFADDDIVHALFRLHPDAADTEVQEALRECIALGHELTRLEEHLGLNRAIVTAASYPVGSLRTKWEAIQTGARIAQEERRRLGLGVAPAGDLVQLLESEGVRTGIVGMPDEVSGLTISHPRVGLFVVVNRNHAPVRQRFSFCHEYAHVLLDRSAVGRISRTTERTDLVEVRANSFAANFLMPEEGVRQFVAGLGKGAASRTHTEIFDEEGVVPVDARTEPGTQDMQIYDVVQLEYFFGVSTLSALFRLRNLKLVSDSQFEQLRTQDKRGSSKLIASVLGIRTMSDVDHLGEFTRRFLGMALEAYRRERITKAKLFELAARIHLGHDRVEQLLEGAGLTAEEPDAVLLPGA